MMIDRRAGVTLIVGMMLTSAIAASAKAESQPPAQGRDAPSVFDGVLSNMAGSSEISTAQLKAALTDSSAIILDARPYEEYAVSHIPSARAVPAKAGTTPALYVADAAEVAQRIPDKTQLLILYCNGLFCGRSERFADDLTKLGYQNVRRYQLGAPGWRALGGVALRRAPWERQSCVMRFTTLPFLMARLLICQSCWKTRKDSGRKESRDAS
jgi:rhodanese-related sulfurtransferase